MTQSTSTIQQALRPALTVFPVTNTFHLGIQAREKREIRKYLEEMKGKRIRERKKTLMNDKYRDMGAKRPLLRGKAPPLGAMPRMGGGA